MRVLNVGLTVLVFGGVAAYGVSPHASGSLPSSVTFSYVGSAQSFTVPADVNSLELNATGAPGGGAGGTSAGGMGATASDTVSVVPGSVYTVQVGGVGDPPAPGTDNGGYNGGGSGGSGGSAGGGGGGASDVCVAPLNQIIDPSNCLIVAAGGGGGGGNGSNLAGGPGGDAGREGTAGSTGEFGGQPGQPGSPTTGGAGGAAATGYSGQYDSPGGPGSTGQSGEGGAGGNDSTNGGGGGGSGLTGGGGGGAGDFNALYDDDGGGGGGGGGSSYAPGGTVIVSEPNAASQVTISYTPAVSPGNTTATVTNPATTAEPQTTETTPTSGRPPGIKIRTRHVVLSGKTTIGRLKATCSAPSGQQCFVKATVIGPGIRGTLSGSIRAQTTGYLLLKLRSLILRRLRPHHDYAARASGTIRDARGQSGSLSIALTISIE